MDPNGVTELTWGSGLWQLQCWLEVLPKVQSRKWAASGRQGRIGQSIVPDVCAVFDKNLQNALQQRHFKCTLNSLNLSSNDVGTKNDGQIAFSGLMRTNPLMKQCAYETVILFTFECSSMSWRNLTRNLRSAALEGDSPKIMSLIARTRESMGRSTFRWTSMSGSYISKGITGSGISRKKTRSTAATS